MPSLDPKSACVPFISALLCPLVLAGCSTAASAAPPPSITPPSAPLATNHILFVGDSYTHGRYLPVRTYNSTPNTGGLGSTDASPLVVDENFGTTVAARAESSTSEFGPWGGIPGIFAEFAVEASLRYDVHIEAISATSLRKNFEAAPTVIVQPLWNAVVLQEATFEPIPSSLSGSSNSNPAAFCTAVTSIEQAVHAASPSAQIYLYETGAPADTAYANSTSTTTFSDTAYRAALDQLTSAYHDAYLAAAAQDGHIAGIAATGDAWARAWAEGVANPDPFGGSGTGVSLTFNFQPGSQPSTINKPSDAGFHHPSVYGAYLNGLVLFQKIAGIDVRTLGASEKAATALGIPAATAVQLQQIAWESVTQQRSTPINANATPCTSTQ